MSSVRIREVLPRDGFQDLGHQLPTETKVAVIERLHSAGMRWIEITSMVSPRWVPQFEDAAEVCAATAGLDGLTRSVFVPNRRGLERTLEAGAEEVSLAVAATDSLSRENFAMECDEALGEILAVAREARSAGLEVTVTIGGAFGCPFEGAVDPERVIGLAERIAEAGFASIFVADTIGSGTAEQAGVLIASLRERIEDVRAGIHLHGGAGALDGVVRAVEAGAVAIDSSTGGVGGCPFVPDAPGNVPTEAVLDRLTGLGIPVEPAIDGPAEVAAAVNVLMEEGRHVRS